MRPTYDARARDFPQSWNRYAYVSGTPLSAVDPLGLTLCFAHGSYNDVATDADCSADGGKVVTQAQVVNVPSGGGGGGVDPQGWLVGNELVDEWEASYQGWVPPNQAGGDVGGGTTSRVATPPGAKPPGFAACLASGTDELNPANLVGLGNSDVAKGLLGGPASTAATYYGGGSRVTVAAGIGVTALDSVSRAAEKLPGNPAFTMFPYITTLTDTPAISSWSLPVTQIGSAFASFFESVNPVAYGIDATIVSFVGVGCAALN